jgi:60 kDa SS-A/Ro ribonucleoprotein
LPAIVDAYECLQRAATVRDVVRLVEDNPSLPWETIPEQFVGEPEVWAALLPNLPLTALMRNLARMTANGCLRPMSPGVGVVVGKLADAEAIRKSRVHPIQCLTALCTYAAGHGQRGKLTWTPIPQIVDALDGAFYAAFGNVEATGKRFVLALDVSGSMSGGEVAGVPGLTPRKASAAMAMVTARTEAQYAVMGFFTEFIPLNFSPRERLDDICERVTGIPFGDTDCALPMLWALKAGVEADCFIVYTDNETWAGRIHPSQALRQYREKTGIAAKLVVCGMVANEFSIADPKDGGMLDVVGFDTATPQIIADFAR